MELDRIQCYVCHGCSPFIATGITSRISVTVKTILLIESILSNLLYLVKLSDIYLRKSDYYFLVK